MIERLPVGPEQERKARDIGMLSQDGLGGPLDRLLVHGYGKQGDWTAYTTELLGRPSDADSSATVLRVRYPRPLALAPWLDLWCVVIRHVAVEGYLEWRYENDREVLSLQHIERAGADDIRKLLRGRKLLDNMATGDRASLARAVLARSARRKRWIALWAKEMGMSIRDIARILKLKGEDDGAQVRALIRQARKDSDIAAAVGAAIAAVKSDAPAD